MNAADIESRVKQLDLTSDNMDGADKKIKAGFWEEFDVSGMFKGYSPPAADESQVLNAKKLKKTILTVMLLL